METQNVQKPKLKQFNIVNDYTPIAEYSIRLLFPGILEQDFRWCSRLFRGGFWEVSTGNVNESKKRTNEET